jgi:hypothetical protein
MAGNRGLLYGGIAVAGVAGYYLYAAGGDAKVAEKKMESMTLLSLALSLSNSS